MTQPKPRIKFTVADYMTTPEDKRYQLLDGDLILAPSPTTRHQRILLRLSRFLDEFVTSNELGEVFLAPYDVIFANEDVAQPDLLFVSNARADIVTASNIQGAPDLVVEILSPRHCRVRPGLQADTVRSARRAGILAGGPGIGNGGGADRG